MESSIPPSIGALLFARPGQVILCILLSIGLAASVVTTAVLVWRADQIHYVWLGSGVQVSRPGEVPRQAIEELSLSMVGLLGNVNAEGLPSAMAAAKAWMTAGFRAKFEAIMALHAAEMAAADIVMLTQDAQVSRIERKEKGGLTVYQTYLTASRTVYVSGEPLPAHQVEIMIESYPVHVPQANLYGLWVNDMAWPRLHTIAGDIASFQEQTNRTRKRPQRARSSVVR